MTGHSESPHTDDPVPRELARRYLEIRNQNEVDSKEFYFAEIMPRLRPGIERYAEALGVRGKYDTLVSLMGFSPETTVHMALMLRPKTLVVAYSAEARATAKPAFDYLLRENLVDYFGFRHTEVDAFDPRSIHDRILKELDTTDGVAVDVTGGTKVMSATAGTLAWELGVDLCYIDGGWNPRSGSAGLTKPSVLKILDNPSRFRGYAIRRQGVESYGRGDFIDAAEKFEESRKIISKSDFDTLGLDLSRCYEAMADFDPERVGHALVGLERTLENGGVRALYEGRLEIEPHLRALRRFRDKDRMAMLAALMDLAELYTRQHRYDFAGLLWYRALEALVETGFHRIAPDFKMTRPDWSLLDVDRERIAGEYDRLPIPRDADSRLPERLHLLSGFGVLCIVDELAHRFRGATPREACGMLLGLGKARNRSYLAHGFEKLTETESRNLAIGADDLARAILRDDHAEFELIRGRLRPLRLDEILPSES